MRKEVTVEENMIDGLRLPDGGSFEWAELEVYYRMKGQEIEHIKSKLTVHFEVYEKSFFVGDTTEAPDSWSEKAEWEIGENDWDVEFINDNNIDINQEHSLAIGDFVLPMHGSKGTLNIEIEK